MLPQNKSGCGIPFPQVSEATSSEAGGLLGQM